MELFKDCINVLENIYNNKKEGKTNIKNELLCQLYSIAYIKIYLFKYVFFSHYNNNQFLDLEEILKSINGEEKNEVRQMVKIYILKVFFYIVGNYQDFYYYDFVNHKINFIGEIKQGLEEKKETLINYYMLPNGQQNKLNLFNEYFDKFNSCVNDDLNKQLNHFINLITNNGIDLFFIISANFILSNFDEHNYVENKSNYLRYSTFVNNLFADSKLKLPEITKKLFMLFSNSEIFNNTIKNKLIDEQNKKEINIEHLEFLLYALRFCLHTTNQEKPNEYLYSKILSQDCENNLNNNCIPGNNCSDNIYIKNYNLIVEHLNKCSSNEGAYVCGCGQYYSINPCGFPYKNTRGNCIICGNKIGYDELPPGIKGTHGFAHVPGHYRIFKDMAQKNDEFKKYNDNDQNIPNLLIDEYKRKIIDPKMEAEKYGINKVSKFNFEFFEHKIRNLTQIGYRLLNFISYSHLFFANCLGFIKNEDMEKYLCDGMTCIQMLEKDWNCLNDALKSKGIQIIQIFINLIFDRLSEKLKNCKELKTLAELDKFEEEVEKLLEEAYKEYDNYSKIYNENNKKLLELDKNSMKSLLLEINDVNGYDEKNYPFYKYFLMTTYPTRESFIHEFKKIEQHEKKYPLITIYLRNDNKEKFLIKYLPEFNEFSNFMIDYYSYKITREEASARIIKDEDIYKNNINNFKDKFNSVIKIWEKLKPYSIKFECRDEMPPVDLDENKELAYFLNDNGDMGKGMYIASAYENFIQWQNNTLDYLIENSKQKGILHHFVKNMERTINVQNAGKNEVLNFDIVKDNFDMLIYKYCKRNIFKLDNSINYMNYKQLIYDFDSIEKSLGELLLPGKVKFEDVKQLKYTTFCFEGFRGNKSSIMVVFIVKYKQIPLSFEKKQIIYDFIQDIYNGQTEELTKIFFSIQLLMNYLTQVIEDEKKGIKDIIDELPENIILSNECKHFFQNEKFEIKIEELVDVYSLFELLCFKPIIKNLNDFYKKAINEEVEQKILKLFDDKIFKIMTKHNLATACRIFISRYLTGSRNDNDFDEFKDLSEQLTRYELWPKEVLDNEEELNNDLYYLKELKIIIGQCFELYNLIEGNQEKESK